MAAMLDDFQTFLVDEFSSSNIVLEQGKNFFATEMPNEPDDCVALFQYGGPEPVILMGNTIYAEKPRLQIRVRSKRVKKAQDLAYELWKFLAELGPVTINGTHYVSIIPASSVFQPGGADEQGRYELASNFEVEREI